MTLCSATTAAHADVRPTIVELYTSEGCSSCPPAERLFESLVKRTDLLPLAFHVDYWDGLGWHDRFSMKEATQRQQDLARTLGLSTIGTPQIVIDGRTAIWGASPDAVDRASKHTRHDIAFTADRTGRDLFVRVDGPVVREQYDVYVVGYLPKAVTAIRSGENAGRTLTEVNVVRYFQKIGSSSNGSGEWTISLATLPADAERLAVFLQSTATGEILGLVSI